MAEDYFHKGKQYAMESNSEFDTGANLGAGQLGGTTSIQSANQLQEASNLLNTGMKNFEISTINPDVFEMIPKQHMTEINRLSKLTGAEPTLHAPIIDPSGFTQQGWSEHNRAEVERQFTEVVNRAHEISPQGNMPITFHSSHLIPGTEAMPANLLRDQGLLSEPELKSGKYKGNEPVATQMVVVNRDTGEASTVKREKVFFPGEGERVFTPEDRLRARNHTEWINKLTSLEMNKKEADQALMQGNTERAALFVNNVETSFNNFYEQAKKFGDKRTQAILDNIDKEWRQTDESMVNLTQSEQLALKSKLLDKTIHGLAKMPGVDLFQPVETFAGENASKTLGNVAFNSFKEFGATTPIIAIENPPYGAALSTGEDLKKLVEKSRDQFVKQAMDKNGMSRSDAEATAKKLIGVTWDTSHISMMRKQGFDAKQLVNESKAIAPMVKKIHLNDNLGYTHTDLPAGMGTVPFKEILNEFEKKGTKGKTAIFEGGGFFQHFKTGGHQYVLQGMGSPMYSTQASPSWNRTYGTMGNYSSGYGPFLPDQHFSIYGAGFSTLPQELGGQVSNKNSRFSGTPME